MMTMTQEQNQTHEPERADQTRTGDSLVVAAAQALPFGATIESADGLLRTRRQTALRLRYGLKVTFKIVITMLDDAIPIEVLRLPPAPGVMAGRVGSLQRKQLGYPLDRKPSADSKGVPMDRHEVVLAPSHYLKGLRLCGVHRRRLHEVLGISKLMTARTTDDSTHEADTKAVGAAAEETHVSPPETKLLQDEGAKHMIVMMTVLPASTALVDLAELLSRRVGPRPETPVLLHRRVPQRMRLHTDPSVLKSKYPRSIARSECGTVPRRRTPIVAKSVIGIPDRGAQRLGRAEALQEMTPGLLDRMTAVHIPTIGMRSRRLARRNGMIRIHRARGLTCLTTTAIAAVSVSEACHRIPHLIVDGGLGPRGLPSHLHAALHRYAAVLVKISRTIFLRLLERCCQEREVSLANLGDRPKVKTSQGLQTQSPLPTVRSKEMRLRC